MTKKNSKRCTIKKVDADIKRELPRVQSAKTKNRKLSTEEMEASIKKMIKEIDEKYTYEQCLLIVPTSDDIPDSLYELLKGSGIDGFAVWNLPVHYLDYKRGKYDVEQFFNDVEKLFGELAREFDEIVDIFVFGNTGRKENKGYERS